jgi:tRNA(Ile)-lysidine synthase
MGGSVLLKKVLQVIRKHRLIKNGNRILVAVSGGPDSTALLNILYELRNELRIKLHVAHLDHRLRADSVKDRDFVETLAGSLNIPFSSERISLKSLSGQGSREEIWRNRRLEFLFKTAQKIKADSIALGHNRDDQAETVLMRLIRGTGLYGLKAILLKRKIGKFTLIRPLVCAGRKEIAAYLKQKSILFRVDSSNMEDIYFRNKIRNNLLPLLEAKYNKNIREVLANIAETAGADYDYLNLQSEQLFKKMGTRIKLDAFINLHPALQRLIMRLAITHLQGSTRRITFQHIRELEDLIFNRPINSIVDLPQGISAVKRKHILHFYSRKLLNS